MRAGSGDVNSAYRLSSSFSASIFPVYLCEKISSAGIILRSQRGVYVLHANGWAISISIAR